MDMCMLSYHYLSLTLAGTGEGGLMQPPVVFFWNIFFCLQVECHHFFYSFPPSFLRPLWKLQDSGP